MSVLTRPVPLYGSERFGERVPSSLPLKRASLETSSGVKLVSHVDPQKKTIIRNDRSLNLTTLLVRPSSSSLSPDSLLSPRSIVRVGSGSCALRSVGLENRVDNARAIQMEQAYTTAIEEIKNDFGDLFIINKLEELMQLEFDETCSVAKIAEDLEAIASYFSPEPRAFLNRLSLDLAMSVITYDEMKESLSGATANFRAAGQTQDCCLPFALLQGMHYINF